MVTAAACAVRGLNVLVLEARSGPLRGFRGELLHPSGNRALQELGLVDTVLAAGAVSVKGFAAFGSLESEPVLLSYPLEEGLALGHERMLASLREKLEPLGNVRIVKGARVTDVLRTHGRVTGLYSHDGQLHRADVVIGADGRHSAIRRLLRIPCRASLLSYTVALGLDGHPLPYPARGHVFLGASGPILAYPYAPRRTRLCIDVPLTVARGRQLLHDYVSLTALAQLPERLRDAALAELAPDSFELCANHAMYTSRCVVRGAALVGDAAGCSHPIAATGMTTALHDALVLSACLCDGGDSLDTQLSRYERRRYRFARAREVLAQALYETMRAGTPGARALRDGLFSYWRSSERARVAAMKILSGEEPSGLALVREYVKVLGLSGLGLCRTALRNRRWDALQPAHSMLATVRTSVDAWMPQRSAILFLEPPARPPARSRSL